MLLTTKDKSCSIRIGIVARFLHNILLSAVQIPFIANGEVEKFHGYRIKM